LPTLKFDGAMSLSIAKLFHIFFHQAILGNFIKTTFTTKMKKPKNNFFLKRYQNDKGTMVIFFVYILPF
jgi:hypothetical protein